MSKTCGPFPRGADWNGRELDLPVFAANVPKIETGPSDHSGTKQIERIEQRQYTTEVLNGFPPDERPGKANIHRAHGPYGAGAGCARRRAPVVTSAS